MLNFFGPIAQFDLLERSPTCLYNFLPYFFGISELHMTIYGLMFFLFGWQLYEFFKEDSLGSVALDFDAEPVLTDLITHKNANYIDFVTLFFSIIFSCNFVGLLPYTQTITSQILFTILLSSLTMLVVWGHAFFTNKILMFNHFLPNGSPIVITPFIIIIELISNFSRIISLSVRLFANMTSGHALLKILASFGLGALGLVLIWKSFISAAIVIIFIITLLELLIAFLQTYVFVTLLLIYISEQE